MMLKMMYRVILNKCTNRTCWCHHSGTHVKLYLHIVRSEAKIEAAGSRRCCSAADVEKCRSETAVLLRKKMPWTTELRSDALLSNNAIVSTSFINITKQKHAKVSAKTIVSTLLVMLLLFPFGMTLCDCSGREKPIWLMTTITDKGQSCS